MKTRLYCAGCGEALCITEVGEEEESRREVEEEEEFKREGEEEEIGWKA